MENPSVQCDSPSRTFGLCLSGGGLRATFYHLGVIRLLKDRGLLPDVTHVSSVSGGSILAAHLVLNWQRYNGTDEEFAEVEQELIDFGGHDLRGRILRRWLLSLLFPLLRLIRWGAFHRTRLLEREYAAFLKEAKLRDVDPAKRNGPLLHIMATSFTTGKLCSFTHKGFWVHHKDGRRQLFPAITLPLALAVTASSAFPPLFPPVALLRNRLDASVEELSYNPELLTDGGVFDNLGFVERSTATANADDPRRPDHLILSDAGAQFDWDTKGLWRFRLIFSRTTRSTDILMQRIADTTLAPVFAEPARDDVSHVPIADLIDQQQFSEALIDGYQKKIPKIRTDLDRFSPLLTYMLMRHGYGVAWTRLEKFARKPMIPPRYVRAEFDDDLIDQRLRQLDRARRRGLNLFYWRDWVSPVLAIYMCALLVLFAYPFFYTAKHANDAIPPFFSQLDSAEIPDIVTIRTATFQSEPYSAVNLGTGPKISSRSVKETPEALLRRYNLTDQFAELTAPNGASIWVKGSAVTRISDDTIALAAPGTRSIMRLGVRTQAVKEDLSTAKASLNAHGGKL